MLSVEEYKFLSKGEEDVDVEKGEFADLPTSILAYLLWSGRWVEIHGIFSL